MKYIATKMYTMKDGYIEMSKEDYKKLKNARDSLFNYLYLETVFDNVMENYNEYEEEALKISSQIILFHHHYYFEMNELRDLLSRRIVNLLTVCKMYKDQKPKYINKMFGRQSEIAKKINSDELHLTNNIIVQTIEFLRDYVQHRGFPIQNLVFSHERIDRKVTNQLRHRVIPKINLDELKDDKKMDENIFVELSKKSKKNQVSLSPIIKEYIQIIGKSHEDLRKTVAVKIDEWKSLIFQTLDKVGKIYQNIEKTGASIVMLDENDLWEGQFTIFTEFIGRIKYFERKNRYYSNLTDRYASNETDDKNP